MSMEHWCVWWQGKRRQIPTAGALWCPIWAGKEREGLQAQGGEGTLQDRSGKLEKLSKIHMNLLSTALQKEKLIVYSAETHQTQAKQKMCICWVIIVWGKARNTIMSFSKGRWIFSQLLHPVSGMTYYKYTEELERMQNKVKQDLRDEAEGSAFS